MEIKREEQKPFAFFAAFVVFWAAGLLAALETMKQTALMVAGFNAIVALFLFITASYFGFKFFSKYVKSEYK